MKNKIESTIKKLLNFHPDDYYAIRNLVMSDKAPDHFRKMRSGSDYLVVVKLDRRAIARSSYYKNQTDRDTVYNSLMELNPNYDDTEDVELYEEFFDWANEVDDFFGDGKSEECDFDGFFNTDETSVEIDNFFA